MSHLQRTNRNGGEARNRRIAVVCLAGVALMVGAAYASVPLYRLFCQVTGYGGTTQAAVNSDGIAVIDREVTVRFDSNVARDLGWKFYPARRSVTLKLGEVKTIHYYVENLTDRTLHGSATFNVTPQQVGAYFNKLECFCFTETEVKPHEKLEMPVVFFVDPELVDEEETRDIRTITLSYTFFAADDKDRPLAATRQTAPGNGAQGG